MKLKIHISNRKNRFKGLNFSVFLILWTITLLISGGYGLIPVPIQQRSTLRAYDTGSMLLHDEFHIPITEYSDPLHVNKDWTYFVSRVQPGEYEFKKFSHATMTATTIWSSIILDDYTIYDSCHNGDVLDYLVVVYNPTNEVQVISLVAEGSK